MPAIDDAYERMFTAAASRLSDVGVVVAAGALYAGGGLALPLLLGWPVLFLVIANVIATLLAGTLMLAWLAVQLKARDRRHRLEWTTSLRLLSAEEFEWLVGEVYRREGWQVRETGRHGEPDGNVDLELERQGARLLVQCKRWTSWQVGVDEVRKLGGTLMREGLPGSAGVLVSLSSFTEAARLEAQRIGLSLVDNADLLSRVEQVRKSEPCPVCQQPMKFDRSPRGWWFRCVARGCAGKRDLGGEASAAVELLTRDPAAL